MLNSPDTTLAFDSSGVLIPDSFVLSWYRVVPDGKISATNFNGARLRSSNIWEEAERIYEKRIDRTAIFKESNYIVTNPVRNNNIVARGHFALPFGYAIRECAKYITGEDTFDEPKAKFNFKTQSGRYWLNGLWLVKVLTDVATFGGNSTTQVGYQLMGRTYLVEKAVQKTYGRSAVLAALHLFTVVTPYLGDVLSDDPSVLERVLSKVLTNCPYMAPSPDMLSMCLTGRFIEPNNPDYWRELWNAMGKKKILQEIVKGKFTSNLQHNLALASRTWNHDIFSEWCDELGYEYSELFYCMLHGGTPKKSKAFYQNVLTKAQCEGVFNAGFKVDYEVAEPPYDYCYPFNSDNIFSHPTTRGTPGNINFQVQQAGLDYMLLFNLYKMADLEKWNTGSYSTSVLPSSNCPCVSYPDLTYTSQVRSILETTGRVFDTIDNRAYDRPNGFFAKTYIANEVINTYPVFDYYKDYEIRIPEYLLHDLMMSGIHSSNKGKLVVHQDLTICNSVVQMLEYSEIEIIPGISNSFPSSVNIANNAKVEMKNGSVIIVNNNSRLMIEANAILNYHPGARIILNGPNAVLHIKGKLELAPGATFQVEGGAAGKGYVIWDCGEGSPHYGQAELIAGAGSKILFSENNINKTALEVRGFSGMYIPAGLAEFKATGCRINLKEQAFIKSAAAHTLVQNVQIFGHNGPSANPDFHWKPSSRGLHIMATPNSIKNVTVHDCLEGIKLFYPGGTGHPLNLDSVYFKNCQNAVINHGGRVKWHSGHADNEGTVQLRTALNGIGTQGTSELSGILLSHDNFSWMQNPPAKFGISAATPQSNIWLHGTGRYYLSNKCKVENGKYGAINSQGFIFPHCSEFMNNQSHFYMNQGARLVAQNNSWNSFNWDFSATDKQFYYGVNGTFLYLEKGKNYIKGHQSNQNTRFIEAELHHTHLQETSLGHTGTNSTAIRATGNQWAIGGLQGMETVPQATATANISLLAVAPGVVSTGAYLDVNYLPVSGGNYFSDREAACASNTGFLLTHDWPVDTPFLQTLDAYNPASTQTVMMLAGNLKSAIETSMRNYPQAIDLAKTLFLADLPVNLASPVFDVYSITHSMYPEVFSDSSIAPANHNAVAAATYTAMLNLQQQLISLADTTEPGIWPQYRFEVHRDLALIHRIFNQRNVAVQYLDQVMPTFQKPADLQALQTWRCLIAKEQAYLDSLIPYHLVNFDTCINVLDSLGQIDTNRVTQWHPDWQNRFGEGNEGAAAAPPAYLNKANNTDKIKINVFPNPGTNVWHINATHGQITKVELWSPQGQQLKIETVQGTEGKISISHLPQGIYFLRVYYEGGTQSFMMMKQDE